MSFGVLLRPLLSISKKRLVATLIHANWQWCNDPSNANVLFERVRVRKSLELFYSETNLTPDAITASIQKLQTIDDFLDESVDLFFKQHTFNHFPLSVFRAQHRVLQRRILVCIIKQLSSASYVPPDNAIHQACEQLMLPDFKGTTLAGLYFRRSRGGIVDVTYERRKSQEQT
jgi:tRNA(Ile)-lysidine synthase